MEMEAIRLVAAEETIRQRPVRKHIFLASIRTQKNEVMQRIYCCRHAADEFTSYVTSKTFDFTQLRTSVT